MINTDFFDKYLNKVFDKARSQVREESYYPLVEKILTLYAESHNYKIKVDSFPKKTEGGNPDIRVLTNKGELVGYIECKDFGKELEVIEDSEQLKRYRGTFPNVILTNFLEFRLYREGVLLDKPVKISDPHPFLKFKPSTIPIQNKDKLERLFEKFLAFSTPRVTTAKSLAIELAKRTRFLRDNVISEELKEEKIEGVQTLEAFYKAFRDHLISSLTLKDFSDLFSQTITYGLFAARSRAADGFNRKLAYDYIPHTIGILRDVFRFISSTDLPQSMEWIVDDITEVLNAANVKKIMHDFYKEGKGKDPIVHFYETFLAEYDPKEREKRGVYYTPEPVVGYIVRSIHKLLKEKFDRKDGFATSSVTVLDPAAGTLTFPAFAIQEAVEEYKNKYGEGGVKRLIKDHILKNFYAFELMMAPYAVGHLKIGFVLDELGYKLSEDERFKLYLTNSLESKDLTQSEIPGLLSLSEESKLAGKVKREIPILVITGNPPYSSAKSEGTEFINNLMQDYLTGLGVEKEKKKGAIQDDYVRFIRFAHWKINQAGKGIIGFITNNSYLDGLVHRSMRKQLLDTFDEIYILNLHGNSRIGETTPEGKKDKNVFDIQQGVSIAFFIKTVDKGRNSKIFYHDLWGLREEKYKYLEQNDVTLTKWEEIKPQMQNFFFTTKDYSVKEIYDQFISVTDIFNKYVSGIESQKDSICIHWNKESLKTVLRLLTSNENNEFIQTTYNIKDSRDWKITDVRNHLKKNLNISKITQILYRPFDERWTYFDNYFLAYPRKPLMNCLFHKKNLTLLCLRGTRKEFYRHFYVTDRIVDRHALDSSADAMQIFPLYVYHENEQTTLIEESHKSSNLQWSKLPAFIQTLPPFASKSTATFIQTTEAIFYYIYAILYSNIYRQKYQEFLKIDFPRIPFTKDYRLFQKLVELGKQLVDLHLLKSSELNKPIAKFHGRNSNLVEKRSYEPMIGEGKARDVFDFKKTGPKFQNIGGFVWINDKQFFAGIREKVWNYRIGGYQALDKWLKDRKGRTLSSKDIKHYCRIVTVLSKTIEIQKKIDKLYPKVEKALFKNNKINN